MKKRLNLLCVLMLLVLSYSVYLDGSQAGKAFAMGWSLAMEGKEEVLKKISNAHPIALAPVASYYLSDSVYNEKTESFVPASFGTIAVSVETGPNVWSSSTGVLLVFLRFIMIVTAIVLFIKLIISVNRSVIFTWKNIARLRWVGILLILCFLGSLIPMILSNMAISDVLSVRGYALDLPSLISMTNLILGIIALIVAEIFAIGLRMKEEQELTI